MDTVDRPLSGWKAIAAFVGRDARTAKRWEATRGLPVHRMPGGERGAVWADPVELGRWMRRAADGRSEAIATIEAPTPPASDAPAVGSVEPAAPASARSSRGWMSAVGLGGVLALAAAAAMASIGPVRTPAPLAGAAYAFDPQARALYLRGAFAWSTRTPAGLTEARDDFLTLARRWPAKPEAFERLADCYLLMREFGTMPEAAAYAAAETATARALALAPRSPGALRAKAFIDFWWHADPAALDLFRIALAAEPTSAQTRHWYANALAARGRFAAARAMIAAAREHDPDTPAIIADQALIEIQSGDQVAARTTLTDLVRLDPGSAAAHRYLALLALIDRDGRTFLAESAAAAAARGDGDGDVRPLAAAWKRGGYAALVGTLAERAAVDAGTGRGTAYAAASYAMLAGDSAGALRLLQRAVDSREPALVGLPGDALLRSLAGTVALYAIGRGAAPIA